MVNILTSVLVLILVMGIGSISGNSTYKKATDHKSNFHSKKTARSTAKSTRSGNARNIKKKNAHPNTENKQSRATCGKHSNCHGADKNAPSKSKPLCGCANIGKPSSPDKGAVKGAVNNETIKNVSGRSSCGKHSNCHGDVSKAHNEVKPQK